MLILVVSTFLASYAILALTLRLGVRWAKIPDVGPGRVLAATAMLQVISAVLVVLGRAATDRGLPAEPVMAAELLASVVVPPVALGAVLRTSPRRALKPWLATLAGSAAVGALLILAVIPHLFEAFAGTGNAMAPTLLGRHRVAACPHCGGPAYASPDPSPGHDDHPTVAANCGRCLRASEVLGAPAAIGPPDRFLVDKLSSPRRWDVVVYRYPEEPSVQYVHRLVGLPGEAVMIKDGAVWLDGRRQVPPPPIDRLAYLPEPGDGSSRPSELSEGSWALGPDEYFVVGDFSARSRDSRAWRSGAPGHPAFAVPGSNLVGVASSIYWPPSRWRRLR